MVSCTTAEDLLEQEVNPAKEQEALKAAAMCSPQETKEAVLSFFSQLGLSLSLSPGSFPRLGGTAHAGKNVAGTHKSHADLGQHPACLRLWGRSARSARSAVLILSGGPAPLRCAYTPRSPRAAPGKAIPVVRK